MTACSLLGEHDRNDLQTLLHAIESEHGAIEHPDSVGWTIERLCVVVAQRRFKPLRRIVGDVTDCAAGERDEPGAACELAVAKVISDPLGRGARIGFSLAIAFDKGLHAFAAHDHLGVRAQKRVARDSFATFNRLQQKRVRRIAGDAHEGADRSVQIGKHRTHYRHDIALARLALKRLK